MSRKNTYRVIVDINTLVGTQREERTIEARDQKAAANKVRAKMGNRDHVIISVTLKEQVG